MKLEFSRQIFEKKLDYQVSWKSAQWEPGGSLRTDRQTWWSYWARLKILRKCLNMEKVNLWQHENIYVWKPNTNSCQNNEPHAELRIQDLPNMKEYQHPDFRVQLVYRVPCDIEGCKRQNSSLLLVENTSDELVLFLLEITCIVLWCFVHRRNCLRHVMWQCKAV